MTWFPSIHPSNFFRLSNSRSRGGGAGAYPNCHRARGMVQTIFITAYLKKYRNLLTGRTESSVRVLFLWKCDSRRWPVEEACVRISYIKKRTVKQKRFNVYVERHTIVWAINPALKELSLLKFTHIITVFKGIDDIIGQAGQQVDDKPRL